MSKQTSTRVEGNATPGDKVTYFDMANQDGAIWEVMTTPKDNEDPKWGWSKGYGLINPENGEISYTDLRQRGWTFA